jgi:hypothetical protein
LNIPLYQSASKSSASPESEGALVGILGLSLGLRTEALLAAHAGLLGPAPMQRLLDVSRGIGSSGRFGALSLAVGVFRAGFTSLSPACCVIRVVAVASSEGCKTMHYWMHTHTNT